MYSTLTEKRIATLAANVIYEALNTYHARYKGITQRARLRFKNRDWRSMQRDAAERLSLYKDVVDHIERRIKYLLVGRAQNKQVWEHIKATYSAMIAGNDDWELAETFFNSITRRILATVGVDTEIEFVNTGFDSPPNQVPAPVYHTYTGPESTADLFEQILIGYPLMVPFQNAAHDAAQVAAKIDRHLKKLGFSGIIDRIEMVRNVFYRGMGAYLIGRIYAQSQLVPLAIALLHLPDGIVVDAVLLDEDDVSILFSFTRSYFHVVVDRPYDLINFLRSILPRKRIAELYISLGFTKHGKTEIYRELLDHLMVCFEDRFDISPGKPGMVMIVFNMPGYDLVFKLIRDRFEEPKHTTRREVMEKYDLVFRHDRAGRLVDAQSFEHLKFDACCFSEQLLAELKREAGSTVRIEDENIIVNHAYVERRVTPLDVFLEQAQDMEARKIVIDWGNTIKDLAVSNIFPGDILLKNFGVTRHGRVVFYDYDELCPLTSCNIRKLPESAAYEDEMASEPWFYVDINDVFPQEFRNFLGLPEPLREVFLQHHADLFEVDFWLRAQQAIQAGNLPHIYPYARSCRIERLSA
jgi:isocitrate dehydrogenase kinase/phosphatase